MTSTRAASPSKSGLSTESTSFIHCMSPPGPAMKPSSDMAHWYWTVLTWPSWREPLHPPALQLAAVEQPVVQPTRPALPELDRLGDDEVAAPLVGHRHVAALEAGAHLVVRRQQLGAVRDRPGLVRGVRAELGAARPGGEVGGHVLARQ